MSGECKVEDERPRVKPQEQSSIHNNMSRCNGLTAAMADTDTAKISPTPIKSRSVPSTPSHRPQSPPARCASPVALRTTAEGSPKTIRTSASRTPPTYRRGMICKYETGMAQARRRVPYTLGPEKLDPDPEGASRKLTAKAEKRLTADARRFYEKLLPTEESENRRSRLVQKLEALLCERWPGQEINVSVFGSTGNKLGTNDSDVDICITTSCKEIEHVCSLADLLARNGMERVVCVSSAKVPIVKIWDPDLQVACDMNVNNPIALENTELIRSYVAIDERFRPLAMLVKHWAKRRIVNDAALGGTLSSYTWICLVLNFLQTREPPILPTLQHSNLRPRLLGGVNVAFDKDLAKYEDFGKPNTATLGELLFEFFHYYGHQLDFETSVMSVRLGKVIPKSEKSWHRLQDNRLCVEEPFNITRNLGNTADDTSVRGIHLEIRRACKLLATGDFEECCEQYVPAQNEPLPRRHETFIQPTTKAIIPQPPRQSQPQHPRPNRTGFKNHRRGDQFGNNGRRASNPVNQHIGSSTPHLRDLPFAMTPQELQLQAQHQQHLLHDQLFQQYQLLQMQEQELRMQLYRQRGLMAANTVSHSGLSRTNSIDDDQESTVSSRTNASSRVPLTAPIYQSRFASSTSFAANGPSPSGIVTNPASPLLGTVLPDSRRYTRRASLNSATASTLRAQSQPARVVPPPAGFPYVTQRFDVPVRQVKNTGTRRSSVNSTHDPLASYAPSRLSSSRYDAGRRPVEYIGYYLGPSPPLSGHPFSATISPMSSVTGLAIHNGGLSPRLSTRSSRLPSVSTSPASHYASVASANPVMAPVTENGPMRQMEDLRHASPSPQADPLVVDGSINSPPRRQPGTRPLRSSSEELDISVTTSEDAGLETPPSSDELVHSLDRRMALGNCDKTRHINGDTSQDSSFLPLDGSNTAFAEAFAYEYGESSSVPNTVQVGRDVQQLTNELAAAIQANSIAINNTPRQSSQTSEPRSTALPLGPVTNGSRSSAPQNTNSAQEWQMQGKKKKKKNKNGKGDRLDGNSTINEGAEVPPGDESLRKGG